MIRIQLGSGSASKAKENLFVNVDHSTSSIEASTQIDTTSKSSLEPKCNGHMDDVIYKNHHNSNNHEF